MLDYHCMSAPSSTLDRREALSRFGFRVGVLSLAGLAARVAYLLAYRSSPPSNDGFYYLVQADTLANGSGFDFAGSPTALHPPAWASVLALFHAAGLDTLLSMQLAAALIGTVTVAIVALAAREIAGDRVGLIATAITALYPNVGLWERELAAETLALPLAAAAVLLAWRFLRAQRTSTLVALAATCALLTLTRAEQSLLFVLLVAPLLVIAGNETTRTRVRWFVVAGSTAALLLLPWTVYNAGRFERPVALTTSLGVTLAASNNPTTYGGARVGHIDRDFWATWVRGDDESVSDAGYRSEAGSYIADNADELPAVLAARQGRTWGFFHPLQQTTLDRAWGNSPLWIYRTGLVVFWLLVPAAIMGAIRMRQRRIPLLPLLASPAIVVIATTLTYGQTRFRAPAEPALVILAAVGIGARLGWTSHRDEHVARARTGELVLPGAIEPAAGDRPDTRLRMSTRTVRPVLGEQGARR